MYAKKQYVNLLNESWDELQNADIAGLAQRRGMAIQDHCIVCHSLDQKLVVDPQKREIFEPDGRPARRIFQIVMLHHLLHPGEEPLSGNETPLHAFQDLMLYHNTIKWRVLDLLSGAFGKEPDLLLEIGAELGGAPREFGDASVRLMPFPQVPWTAVVHEEDEEFPADAQVLFDESAVKIMSPEDMVVLSELLAHRIANMASIRKNS